MQLCLIHLDDSLRRQTDFMETCIRDSALQLDAVEEGSTIRLWGKAADLKKLKEKISSSFKANDDAPKLCFIGSGDFHHVTALLLEILVENIREPVTIIHFDNHPDWVHFKDGMHCGSWVNRAASLPFIDKVITAGVCSDDLNLPEYKGANLSLFSEGKLELFPFNHKPSYVRKDYAKNISFKQADKKLHWETIQKLGEQAFLELLISRITTKSIYVTVDKDVLDHDASITNWDQGQMSLPYLLQMIKTLGSKFNIIGADVTGDFSTPEYSGNLLTRLFKRAEILIDQPKNQLGQGRVNTVNSLTNHVLLDVFSEVMP